MKVIDFDGREHNLKLAGKNPLNNDIRPKSALHLKVRQLLKKAYTFSPLYEEVHLPIGLYLDFFIPSKRLAVECDGNQHDEFTPFFHRTPAGFANAKARDARKDEFCQINNIRLVRLKPFESDEEWLRQIFGATDASTTDTEGN